VVCKRHRDPWKGLWMDDSWFHECKYYVGCWQSLFEVPLCAVCWMGCWFWYLDFYFIIFMLCRNIVMSWMTTMMILYNLLHQLQQVCISEAFMPFLVHYFYCLLLCFIKIIVYTSLHRIGISVVSLISHKYWLIFSYHITKTSTSN
jgi:hypothetical protein